nr:aldehyde ferredoxin oxidoreductase N-terminal domain-containing protein [Candidatus Sigynarchaeota archaeon]
MDKCLKINAYTITATYEAIPEQYTWFGGRELTSAILSSHVNPACDPLGPENSLVIATGLLAGTPAPNFSRTSIGAKSPLTG